MFQESDAMMFYLMVLLCLSLTSLVTCSQDTCPAVVVYSGDRSNIKKQVKGRAILGYSYKNFTTDTFQKCFPACVDDCRCVSCQYSGTRCELVDENRHTAPDSFKVVPGYIYVELEQKFRNKHSCYGQCNNGCCRSSLCQNGGTCMELCDNVTRKFECKCRGGYGGRVCELPPTCSGYQSETFRRGPYPIMASNGKKVNVFCDMISGSGKVWTLVQSFAWSNKDDFKDNDFTDDYPAKESDLNFNEYRLSLSVMQHIKTYSTHWMISCEGYSTGEHTIDAFYSVVETIYDQCKDPSSLDPITQLWFGSSE